MTSIMPVRTSLVGYGYWGSRFAAIAARVPQLELVGIVDEHVGADDFTPHPSIPSTANLDAVLTDPRVEAVILATPATSHAADGARILEAGKHLFVEKPFTTDLHSCDALIVMATSRDLSLAVDHQYWWSAEVEAIRTCIASGGLGRIVAVSVERSGDGPARYDVDALWDRGIHDISVLLQIGVDISRPKDICRVDVRDGRVAGCVRLTGRFGEGALALSLHSCWMGDERRRLVVTGAAGSVVWTEDAEKSSAYLVDDVGSHLLSETPKSAPMTPIERGLREFAESVRHCPDRSRAVMATRVIRMMHELGNSSMDSRLVLTAQGCWL